MKLQLQRLIRPLHRRRKGITGLETSIILIAFVVVASVFAYTVLSAGIFTSQKNQEALSTGLRQARSTMKLVGIPVAYGDVANGSVSSLRFTVGNALSGYPIDLRAPTDTAEGNGTGNGIADPGSTHVTVITYSSETEVKRDLDYTTSLVGWGDADSLLEAGEQMDIVVDLSGVNETIGIYKSFKLEIKPAIGSTLAIEKIVPGQIDRVMLLW